MRKSRILSGTATILASAFAAMPAMAYNDLNVPAMNGFPGNVNVYSSSGFDPVYASVLVSDTVVGSPGWWLVPLNSLDTGLSVPVYATWGNTGCANAVTQTAQYITLNSDGTYAGAGLAVQKTSNVGESSLGTASVPLHGTLYVQFGLQRTFDQGCASWAVGKAASVRYGNQ